MLEHQKMETENNGDEVLEEYLCCRLYCAKEDINMNDFDKEKPTIPFSKIEDTGVDIIIYSDGVRGSFHDYLPFPAIDILRSGTRKEEMLISEDEKNKMWIMRGLFSNMNQIEVMEELTKRMKISKSNKDFFKQMELGVKE